MDVMNGSTLNITTLESSANTSTYELLTIDLLTIILLSCHIACLFTHSYVIWIIVRGTASGLASELLNLNLSIFEIVLSLNSLVVLLIFKFPIFQLVSMVYFFMGISMTGRPLFQCLICVERYLAVVHPVTFLKYKPLRYRAICCAAAWIITLGSCLIFMLVVISFSEITLTWFCALHYLFFFSIQVCCLASVLRALKQSGPGDRKREEENSVKRRAFYLILITTVCLLITYTPITIVGIHRILAKTRNDGLLMWSQVCYILAGYVQPVLYLHRVKKLSCASFVGIVAKPQIQEQDQKAYTVTE